MKAFWTYTLARIGVFVVTFAVLWGVTRPFVESGDATNLLILLVAAVISSVISFFALAGLRDKLALHVQHRAERISEQIEKSRSAEDVD